ncbi:hypothetical protein [Paludisphaera soli]|uniref:hypothetical protein n=1 Tax=Paludisphaera soli TaxID=2712865 RepID=UPI0013EB3ADA|nr:hypothetical protein [Paludisphaera soli]
MINARNRRRAAWKTSTRAVLLGMGVGLCGPAAPTTAAPVRPGAGYTLSADARRAVVLDQEGRRIAIPRSGGGFPERTTPTYVAYRLPGRSQVPEGVPTVAVTPGPGGAGPLRLDALALRALDAQLAASDRVAVLGPRQSFLVSAAAASSFAGDGSTQYWRPGVQGGPGGKSFGDTVGGWYDSSADAVKKINDQIADAFKKAFNPDPPKPVIIPPTRVAAQVLEGPMRDEPVHSAQGLADDAQPAPVPEPAAWLVFAAASALGLRLRPRKAAGTADPA